MRAVGILSNGADETLVDVELAEPTPGPHDLLVEVRAVSVNPVDTKVRASATVPDGVKVLGWDAAGIVRAVGASVTLFAPGDEVYYAGSLDRSGSNAELHVVDERIVGPKPASLTFAQAAALPLTAITAWELLFDRLGVERGGGAGKRLLIAGAAGGVGSILTQLAVRLTRLEVIGTASRPESAEWVQSFGAHRVIDHRVLASELRAIGPIDLVASLTGTDVNFTTLVEGLRPQGRIAVIDDPQSLDVVPLKRKSGSLHWEFMFTRPMFGTEDLVRQHELLTELSRLVDEGVIRTTLSRSLSPISAETLIEAHTALETGGVVGKIVVSEWE